MSDSGIFESFGWSVQGRQDIRSADRWFSTGGLSDVTELRNADPRAFAGVGGEPAFASMDAVM
jgi:hypothetical protein